jgi:hypothetical protein
MKTMLMFRVLIDLAWYQVRNFARRAVLLPSVRFLVLAGFLAGFGAFLASLPVPARAYTQGMSTGMNFAGNATNVLRTVATIVGTTTKPGYGKCNVTIINFTQLRCIPGTVRPTFR